MGATMSRFPAVLMAVMGLLGMVLPQLALSQDAADVSQLDVAGLVETATSGSGRAQYVAIDDLGEHAQEAATVVPALEKLLTSDDVQVRWRSARALGDYGEAAQAAAPALRDLLAEESPVAKYQAAVALGKIGDQSDATVDALVSAATGHGPLVARAAIAAIREIQPGPERVVAALQKALASDDHAVVVHALEAIVERGAEAAPFLNEALKQPETVYIACAAIEHIGPDAATTVPGLTKLLSDTKHSHLLIQTLLALASIGPAAESASPKIVPLLENTSDPTVPVAAAYALGSVGAKDADDALRGALAKSAPFLQMVAAWSLAKIHPDDAQLKKQAMEKLEAGLKSDDPAIAAAAEKGIGLLNPPADGE